MGWRRAADHTLVAWRAPREQVLSALLAEQVPAAVGPEDLGWTLVRLLVNGDEVVEPRCRDLLDLLDDLARTLAAPAALCEGGDWNERTLVVVVPGGPAVSACIPGLAGAEPASRGDWAQVLHCLGALDALEPVLSAVAVPRPPSRRDRTAAALADRRHRAVARAAGLPVGLLDGDAAAGDLPEREVLLSRGVAAPDVAVAASALGTALSVAPLGELTAVAVDPIEGSHVLPVATFLSSGRAPALLLWRQADARGYQLVRRGDVVDAHEWDSGWQVVPEDLRPAREDLVTALAPERGDAATLAERFAPGAQVDVVALRALLRRPPDARVLRQLCGHLGVDPRAAGLVEGELGIADLPQSRAVRPTTMSSAIWAAASAPRASDPWILRAGRAKPWWWRLSDVVWVVVALAWAADLWQGNGPVARAGCVVLVLTALWGLYDAVTPASRPAQAPE